MPNCSFPFVYSFTSLGLEEGNLLALGFTQVSRDSGALTPESAPSLLLWTETLFLHAVKPCLFLILVSDCPCFAFLFLFL